MNPVSPAEKGVQPRYVPVITMSLQMGQAFLKTLTGATGSRGEIDVGDQHVLLEVLDFDPATPLNLDRVPRQADAIILLVRFLDSVSMERIKTVYRHLPDESTVPMSVIAYRENGETSFKMSCPSCGQKLWVRDAESGLRGRCPNCKKMFLLPSQEGHLKSYLILPGTTPIITLAAGNASAARAALVDLLGRAMEQEAILKSTTMRVQIPDEDNIKNTTMRIQVPGEAPRE